MGSLLRTAGGMGFLFTLFIPIVKGCGVDYDARDLAGRAGGTAGEVAFVALVVYAIGVVLPPYFERRISRLLEMLAIFATLGVATLLWETFQRVQQKGATLLSTAWFQFGALSLVLLGCLIRLFSRQTPSRRH